MKPNQLEASRLEQEIDAKLMSLPLQLSMLSPVFVGGCSVSVHGGGRENCAEKLCGKFVGTSPAKLEPHMG